MEFTNQSLSIKYEKLECSKESLATAKGTQLISKALFYEGHEQLDGHSEITPWVYCGFSPFPSAEGNYPTKREDRNNFKIKYDENDKHYLEIKTIFNRYFNAYEEQKNEIFKDDKKRLSETLIKDPINENENEKTGVISYSSRLSIEPKYYYYYNNELLDEKNVALIQKTLFADKKPRKGTEFTTYKENLSYKIRFPQDSQDFINVTYQTGLENRKELDLIIIYREIENYNKDTMKNPNDCSEEELTEIFGEPKTIKVKTPEEIDSYCNGYSFYKYSFELDKLWTNIKKDTDIKKYKGGLKFIIPAVSVIRLKTTSGEAPKKQSKSEKSANLLLGKSVHTKTIVKHESEDDDVSMKTHVQTKKPVVKSESEDSEPEPPKKATASKKQVSKSESEDSDPEPPKKATASKKQVVKSESESESEDSEPEPPKKATTSKKQVVKSESEDSEPEPPKKTSTKKK